MKGFLGVCVCVCLYVCECVWDTGGERKREGGVEYLLCVCKQFYNCLLSIDIFCRTAASNSISMWNIIWWTHRWSNRSGLVRRYPVIQNKTFFQQQQQQNCCSNPLFLILLQIPHFWQFLWPTQEPGIFQIRKAASAFFQYKEVSCDELKIEIHWHLYCSFISYFQYFKYKIFSKIVHMTEEWGITLLFFSSWEEVSGLHLWMVAKLHS